MVWQIVNRLDTETSKKIPLSRRSPFLEYKGHFAQEFVDQFEATPEGIDLLETVKLAASAPSPRVIKSHLPFEFLPPNLLDRCKVIFVGRRPKDCCVSLFHHFQTQPKYQMKSKELFSYRVL